VLVEYETIGQAIRAREKMKLQRDKLGDRKSEITLLIDNEKITRKYPNINNQIRYQRKRQSNTSQMNPQPPMQQPVDNAFYNPINQPFVEQKQEFDFDGIMGILNEHVGNMDVEEEHQLADWSGFLTKNKKDRCGVDFVRIHK